MDKKEKIKNLKNDFITRFCCEHCGGNNLVVHSEMESVWDWMMDILVDYFSGEAYISGFQKGKEGFLNQIHAVVCDLEHKIEIGEVELSSVDCLELVRYQIERRLDKKLLSVKQNL